MARMTTSTITRPPVCSSCICGVVLSRAALRKRREHRGEGQVEGPGANLAVEAVIRTQDGQGRHRREHERARQEQGRHQRLGLPQDGLLFHDAAREPSKDDEKEEGARSRDGQDDVRRDRFDRQVVTLDAPAGRQQDASATSLWHRPRDVDFNPRVGATAGDRDDPVGGRAPLEARVRAGRCHHVPARMASPGTAHTAHTAHTQKKKPPSSSAGRTRRTRAQTCHVPIVVQVSLRVSVVSNIVPFDEISGPFSYGTV
eukprot:234718-Prymnesium_polylepis.3